MEEEPPGPLAEEAQVDDASCSQSSCNTHCNELPIISRHAKLRQDLTAAQESVVMNSSAGSCSEEGEVNTLQPSELSGRSAHP